METQTLIETDWQQLISAYSRNEAQTYLLWQELEDRYTSEDRHYHNLDHIGMMLDLCKVHEQALLEPDTIRFAIFYHDVIYNSSRNDNELKSAAFAEERLKKLNVPQPQIEQVKSMIMATKTHKPDRHPDTNWLLDFDLAILGTTPGQYALYARQIRQEYSIFPDILYKLGRKKVLEYFLNQPRIYKTETIRKKLEKQARENLQWELESIR